MRQNQKIAFAQVVEVLGIDEDFAGSIEDEMASDGDDKQSGDVDGMVNGDEVDWK